MSTPSTTSVKLDVETKERIQRLASARRRSAHWVMREAIEQYVEREEKREQFRQDALAAWTHYQTTGRHATAEEADAWLAKLKRVRTQLPRNVTTEVVATCAARCRPPPFISCTQEPQRCTACHQGDSARRKSACQASGDWSSCGRVVPGVPRVGDRIRERGLCRLVSLRRERDRSTGGTARA